MIVTGSNLDSVLTAVFLVNIVNDTSTTVIRSVSKIHKSTIQVHVNFTILTAGKHLAILISGIVIPNCINI